MNSEEIKNHSAESVLKTIREGRIILIDNEDRNEESELQHICDEKTYEQIRRDCENRCFAQQILYDIYYKPDKVPYNASSLNTGFRFRGFWRESDHNKAVLFIELFKDDLDAFKYYISKMEHQHDYPATCFYTEPIRECYNKIIDYYEATGILTTVSDLCTNAIIEFRHISMPDMNKKVQFTTNAVKVIRPPSDEVSLNKEFRTRCENRIYVYHKLYETYFKSKGINYSDAQMIGFMEISEVNHMTWDWDIQHHNDAVRLLKLFKGDMVKIQHCINKLTPARTCKIEALEMIIEYYKATGFLEELDVTNI